MLASQKLAIAAHVHVLLRRKTGRVTDTEWMAHNLEYALEIVRFTRAKALEDGHPELDEWADKLERVVLDPSPVQHPAVAQSALQLLKDRAVAAPAVPAAAAPAPRHAPGGFANSIFGDSIPPGSSPEGGKSYVGGIR